MRRKRFHGVFLVLGVVLIIAGLLIYPNSVILSIGVISLIIGLIGKFGKRRIGRR
jgi:1,4-dihydroxy-2-naphthoate octaprenyltransferase